MADTNNRYTHEPIPLHFEYRKNRFTGLARPIPERCHGGKCHALDVFLDDQNLSGTIERTDEGTWRMEKCPDDALTSAIGKEIDNWFAKHEISA